MMIDGLCPLTTQASLARAAMLAPDVEAIVAPDGRLTYAELLAETARLRSALAMLGVRHGDHVGLCFGNTARFATLFLALGSLGAVTVPVNTRFKAQELGYVLRQSRVRFLFTADRLLSSDFIAMLREVAPEIDQNLPPGALPDLKAVIVDGAAVPAGAIGWDRFVAAAGPEVPAACNSDDSLLIQYTSGSTAFPKGVLLPHRNMLANGFLALGRVGLRLADRYYCPRPFFHVAGTTLAILGAMQHAATLVTSVRFEAEEALRLMEEESCTHFSGNDTMVLAMLNHPDLPRRSLRLRGGWTSASPSVMRRVMDEMGAREVVSTYGMSEASPNIAISCWWEPEHVRIANLTTPLPGVELRLRDGDGRLLTERPATGEIQVRGWNVMRGYLDNPAETQAALSPDGWLSTGDIGRIDAEDRLAFVGRAKEIVRVGGENVSPLEVEDILNRHPDIAMAQVVGVPDARLTEVTAAFVTLKEGRSARPGDIIAWSKEQMAGFKVPRHIAVVEDFESIGMTGSGKILRRKLAEHALIVFGLSS